LTANLGYDIESEIPNAESRISHRLGFIEVKGRIRGMPTVTITKNEILTAFNKPEDWMLALVEVPPSEDFPEGDAFVTPERQAAYGALTGCVVRYLCQPFTREPDFHATSVNYDWQKLWERGTMPW
jgi:hypothetical protein